MKRCSKCGVEYPATAGHFDRNQYHKDGLASACKGCTAERKARYRAKNADKERERHARYNAENADKRREYASRYRTENADKAHKSVARYRTENADKIHEREARYRAENADKVREAVRRYRAKNPDKAREYDARRRARKNGLPAAPVSERLARDYFNDCCAVCGRPAGLWHIIAMDHWIAMDDKRPNNPGTVPTNMIPMCHSIKGANGQGSCNLSKGNKDPIAWLNQQYGKRKAAQIIKRIEAYFEWVRQQEQEAA